MEKKLCLNMIVRNEADRILRCLASVADYVSFYVIVDTGSTDRTVELIYEFFNERKIPGIVYSAAFVNFEQARNLALDYARARPDVTNILLVDADMELVVEDKTCFDNLTGPSYDIVQRAGTLHYGNRRIVSSASTGKYIGVTHEYLDIPSAGVLSGVWFSDHADGANRKDKYVRDVKLLRDALKKEPNNGRYWFYLAQSYRDAGKPDRAAKAYQKRMALGGWDEELWNAHLNYAHCLRDMGNEAGFVKEILACYNYRPSRAEPLYDLAKHYRDKGMNAASTAISEIGMTIKRPGDLLFLANDVYQFGFRQEFAITAFYDEKKRSRGFKICNDLALDRTIPDWSRETARRNLFFYTPKLPEIVPVSHVRIPFTAPDGYVAMNPSIVTTAAGQIAAIVRTVNYTITDSGHYQIRGGDGSVNGSNPIHTRNFLIKSDHKFEVFETKEIDCPMHHAKYDLVRGMEDMRLFEWKGDLWASTCVREANPEGWCEQYIGRLVEHETRWGVGNFRRMIPPERAHEKNWMPWVNGEDLKFVYRLGTTITPDGHVVVSKKLREFDFDHLSGGSQVIPYNGLWLAVVHEARDRPDTPGRRCYTHRFVLLNNESEVVSIGRPFFIEDRQIEFVAGLARHPDGKRLMLSYGVRDHEAAIATIDLNDIPELLR